MEKPERRWNTQALAWRRVRAEVVGDADLGAQVGELVEGPAARWSRCRWW